MQPRCHTKAKVIAIFMTALMPFLLYAASCTAECALKTGWEAYPPYPFKDSPGNVTGFDLDMVKALMKRAGCKVTFKEIPWTRIIKYVAHGQLDFTAGASKTPEREQYDQKNSRIVRLFHRSRFLGLGGVE